MADYKRLYSLEQFGTEAWFPATGKRTSSIRPSARARNDLFLAMKQYRHATTT
jgi:hypothetical protein